MEFKYLFESFKFIHKNLTFSSSDRPHYSDCVVIAQLMIQANKFCNILSFAFEYVIVFESQRYCVPSYLFYNERKQLKSISFDVASELVTNK